MTAPGDYRFYGRRRGRPLNPGRRRALEIALPVMRLPDGPLDPGALFDFEIEDLWLEIGFGAGEHLLWQAARRPHIGFIGAEPYINGVASLAMHAAAERLANLRIHCDDAASLLDRLPAGAVGRVFILFPDPWPKARHHHRRLVAPPVLDRLARTMRKGAELRLATDHNDYLDWMLEQLTAHPAFTWTATCADDWRRRSADWPETRYEAKARAAGVKSTYLHFVRCDGVAYRLA
ncbi:MAG: tRNA (guanosine(46)-N7)-methyltransferase TrmB [Alphaproteobacteria bacterium]|nr:tRNA (guanosine(46)-N7)-methyltransferase TrmB [Alphaproteobacteria bacterium]MCY4231313.1 tRNA (guanosine(46)-N7)-methyltransferase TrmB [Alphaproteobacteria bacterium]MCY4318245.1 tRNA (guanosine(46)-N7)-methyltransferase TrmB [Alphaproteobacteria bacterium]